MIEFRSFFFSNVCIQCHTFSSKHCFNYIPRILTSCVFISFHFQNNFKFLLRFFLCLMWCVLLNLHIFWNFLVIFLLLISGLIPLWSEGRHCIISFLLSLSRWVLWPQMWSVLVNVPCELEKNVYSSVLDEVVYRHQLYPVDWWCCWVQLCPYWFSACWISPFLIKGYWNLQLW